MKQTVSSALKETVAVVREEIYYWKDDDAYNDQYYKNYTVTIEKKGGSTITREVLFSQEDIDYIDTLYIDNTEYLEALTRMPEKSSISSVSIYGVEKTDAVQRIWKAFCEEYNNLSYADRIALNGISQYIGTNVVGEKDAGRLYIRGYENSEYYVSYTISDKTPKAYHQYLIESGKL